MNRYYMTAETRQALIAESNRLIAARAEALASRRESGGAEPSDSEWARAHLEPVASSSEVESAFARLVSDLQSTSGRSSLS